MATIRMYERTVNGKVKVSYQVMIRIKGAKPIYKTFDRKTDAENWAKAIESDIKRGKRIETPESRKHTINELIDKYIDYKIPQRKSEQEKYVKQLLWWKDKIGAFYLANVSPSKLAECKELLETEPSIKPKHGRKTRTPATVNRYLMILSSVFSYAIYELNWIDENPMHKIRKNPEKANKERYLSKEEINRILNACNNFDIRTENYNKQTYLFVLIALSTGARYSEIYNLKWENIDFKHKQIYFMNTKNGDHRGVAMTEKVCRELKEFQKIRKINNNNLWATNSGKKLIDMRVRFYKVLELANINDFRFHDIRHTTASYLAMNGASLIDIASILGHKTMQMVKRYSHLTQKHTQTLLQTTTDDMFTIAI